MKQQVIYDIYNGSGQRETEMIIANITDKLDIHIH